MTKPIFSLILSVIFINVFAQLPDSCKLQIGTNLGGLADWGTELPFKDMMHHCRQWYTKDIGNPEYPWNSEMADYISLRSDGYPTQVPQQIPESQYQQMVATIWAITDGWLPGSYVVLFDGDGDLNFWGGINNLVRENTNRYTFDFY
ncbi:MAG: hypothetical protein R2771_12210 [Saprospiraceae bacterium]